MTRQRKSNLKPLPVVVHGGPGTMVVPMLLSAILCQHTESCIGVLAMLYSDGCVVWLLRDDGEHVVGGLVDRLMGLPPSASIKVC